MRMGLVVHPHHNNVLGALMQRELALRLMFARSRYGRMRFRASRFVLQPPDLNLSDPSIAEDIASGQFVLAGRSVMAGARCIFDIAAPSQDFANALHSFEWLRHFDANERSEIRKKARRLLIEWLDRREAEVIPAAENPAVIPARVMNWIAHSALLVEGVDLACYQRILNHLARDAAILALISRRKRMGVLRLEAAISLTIHVLGLDRSNIALREAESLLQRALMECVSSDGGLLNRDAGGTARIASQLITLLALYRARTFVPPAEIGSTILRMVSFLRMMQHPDGGLALFHGAGLVPRDIVSQVTQFGSGRVSQVLSAPETGFERLENMHGIVIADTGVSPPLHYREKAGASALAFEFSTKTDRLIVNCGIPLSADEENEHIYRSGVAHSTCLLNDESLGTIVDDVNFLGQKARILHPKAGFFPPERHQDEMAQSLILRHDGLVRETGYRIERTLLLDDNLGGLIGQDRFVDITGEERPCRASLLFHLNPRCAPRPLSRPDSIVLRFTHQNSGRDLWLFEAPGFVLSLQESRCFISQNITSPKTWQIVLEAVLAGTTNIAWRIIPFRGA